MCGAAHHLELGVVPSHQLAESLWKFLLRPPVVRVPQKIAVGGVQLGRQEK
jgi:hypothetical protein